MCLSITLKPIYLIRMRDKGDFIVISIVFAILDVFTALAEHLLDKTCTHVEHGEHF